MAGILFWTANASQFKTGGCGTSRVFPICGLIAELGARETPWQHRWNTPRDCSSLSIHHQYRHTHPISVILLVAFLMNWLSWFKKFLGRSTTRPHIPKRAKQPHVEISVPNLAWILVFPSPELECTVPWLEGYFTVWYSQYWFACVLIFLTPLYLTPASSS
jgi:hypothetical protein